jgi:flagellar hook assembly protein FlgD
VIKIFVNHLSDSLFAFPNPFGFNRDVAQISYYLPNSSDVTVTIYDPFGNQVRTMYFRERTNGAMAGDNTIYWNGRNAQGRRVASGIYTIQVVGQRHTGIGFKSAYRIGVIW